METTLITAVITAVAALIGAFIGSIGRPIAEDRVARWREARVAKAERRDRERARIEKVVELLAEVSFGTATPPWNRAHAALTSATAAVNDERLTELVGRFRTSGSRDELTNAKWRAGELIRELDEKPQD